ncbi:alpha/beta fold hydrolase [Rhodohalobacter barkolensis]|nr:alpha/beta fold hydrolase [Rhodohalobacter barkolensis]
MNTRIFKSDSARERMNEWYQQFLDRVNVPSNVEEVSTTYGKNHVLTIGDHSKTPLVCLHTMLTSSAHIISELALLSDQFYIIAPDLPGQSVKGLPIHLSYKDHSHSEWLKEILDGLNLQESNLLGVSLGGFVARQFASEYPERVLSLTLIVPAGIVRGSLIKGFSKMALPMMMYKMRPGEKNLRRLVKNLITTWDEDWANYLGDAFLDFIPNIKIPPLASDEELQNLTMPCLVIGAENDISFPGNEIIIRVKNQIPNVETEFLKSSNHSPPTTPEFRSWLNKRVKEFIPNTKT